jgi:hypothetical protein
VSKKYLRRYVDLPALIYLLRERAVTLLDPKAWDDNNDSYYLALYREKKKLKSLLALCFTQTTESYRHWRVFAGGSSGICIRFERSELLKAINWKPGLRTEAITYLTLGGIQKRAVAIEELPFLKRHAFEHEDEYRIIYESKTEKLSKLDLAIPLSCIDGITLSPRLHPALYQHVTETLRSLKDCDSLNIARSTLISNEEWKSYGEGAAI